MSGVMTWHLWVVVLLWTKPEQPVGLPALLLLATAVGLALAPGLPQGACPNSPCFQQPMSPSVCPQDCLSDILRNCSEWPHRGAGRERGVGSLGGGEWTRRVFA